MKVLHLISGGDTGGAKTHVHTLLAGLTPRIQVKMVCFTEGPFTQEARALGIDTEVIPGRNFFPESAYLRRQRLLLGRANICTIDAFCMQLLKRYFATPHGGLGAPGRGVRRPL